MHKIISRTLSIALVAGCALGAAGAASGQVWLRSSPGTLTTIGEGDVGVKLAELRGEGDVRIAVQLDARADDATREILAAGGMTLLSPLGNDAFFAKLDAKADVAMLAQSKLLRGVSAIDATWKIDRKLLGDIYSLYGVTDAVLTRDADPVTPVMVMLHADLKADAAAAAVLKPFVERVRGSLESIPVIVAEMRQSQIAALAREDAVQWIAPALPEMTGTNAENRTLTQAAQLQAAPYGLTGAGVSVLVFDSGNAMTTHVDFQGRMTIIDAADADTVQGHSTHCAGTVGGAGVANATHRGMAPGVTLLSGGLGTLTTSGWLYTNPLDIEANYTTAVNQGADLATNSIGTNVSFNGFSCAWMGDYNVTDILIDNIVRGALPATGQQPFRVTWAAGNERGSTACSTGFRSTAPPSNNKNAMVIGAVDSVTQAMTNFSSWGPTDDGRMKPDFATGGCQVGGDGGVTSTTFSTTNNTSYASLCGTSMATPTVAGVCALIMQDCRAQFPSLGDPRNSTLKALLAQTAVDLGNPGPDYQFGYGSIRAKDAVDLMRSLQFTETPVVQGGVQTRTVTVPAGAPSLKITMAWDDAPGTPNVIPSLVNDVDLEMIGPTGVVHLPWTLDPANPANSATQASANRRDNMEQIFVANPPAGVYTLRVVGFNVPTGPQTVSLVSSHPFSTAIGGSFVVLSTPTLAPSPVLAATPQTVSVRAIVGADQIAAGSARLWYAANAGTAYESVALTQAGEIWSGQLPGFACGNQPRYYFEIAGVTSGLVKLPAGGASAPYTFDIGGRQDLFSDTLQTNQGWSVTNTPIVAGTATTGAWELADPEATSANSLVVQPGDDRTSGSGTLCWVTGAAAGASAGSFDIDNLTTTLTSPAYNGTAFGNPMLSFWRWFNNSGNTARDDTMIIQLSNDNGGAWQTVQTVGPGGSEVQGGWVQTNLRLRDFFAVPSANVRFRVTVADTGAASVVEALVDDVTISDVTCVIVGCNDVDFNNNGVFPEDQDVTDFFGVLAGATCGACDDIDFNNNGVFPEDQDVVDFFNVLAGGNCP
jgi:hypothetical protein